MSWKPIPQEICLANLIEKPLWWYLPRNFFPPISRRYPPQRQKYFGGYPPRHRIYFEDTVWDVRYQTICEGQLSTKQISNGNIFQTNTKGNLYQRVSGKTCLPKKPKEKSLQKKSEEQTQNFLYQKLSRKIPPRKLWRDIPCEVKIWRTVSTKTFVSRDISLPNKLKKHLYKKTSEEKSLPKRMKKHLHQKIREKQQNKKHCKNRNWWNLMKQRFF